MDNEYDDIFNEYSEGSFLFRGESFDIDKFINSGGQSNFISNANKDFDYGYDEFLIDKSDTKSNSLHRDDRFNDNNNFSQAGSNEEELIRKEKIFVIMKDHEKKLKNEMRNLNILKHQMSLSQRMKFKKEKTKFLLEKKKREESGEDGSITSCRDYIVDQDKLVMMTDNLDNATKKEIKVIRNRMSAQKSRDRRKKEFEELQSRTQNLISQNCNLQKRLEIAETELQTLKLKIKNCTKCSKEDTLPIQNNLSLVVSDMSPITRSNLSGRTKVGMFSGFLLVLLLIGCFVFYPEQYTKIRILQSSNQPSETPLSFYSRAVVPYPETEGSEYPVSWVSDEVLLKRKRHDFILKIANKIKKFHNGNFRDEYKNQNLSSNCLSENGISCKITDESKAYSNSIVPYFNPAEDDDYTKEKAKVANKLHSNVESLLVKDYTSSSANFNRNFDEIINKTLSNGYQVSKDNDCLYLHMILPSKHNEQIISDQGDILNNGKAFYEIGCKIFEINKIYK